MRWLLPWLLVLPASAAESDAERLAGALPAGFVRPVVRIHPLLIQGEDLRAAALWQAFGEALAARRNLDVSSPESTVAALKASPAYEIALRTGERELGRGYADYREVRLEQAVTSLRAAVARFVAAGHHFVDPRGVARAQLTIGLAQLESGDGVGADQSLRAALLLDPTVKLRAGYDRPEAVAALEQARAAVIRSETAPRPFSEAAAGRAVRLYGRSIAGRVEVAIHAGGTLSIERQTISDDPAADGERLASRVWACLPFGRAPGRTGHRARLLVDAGFGYHVFTSAPVTFGNFGIGGNFSWLVAPHLALDVQASIANSGRDGEEDLRQDIVTGRLFLGPGYSVSGRRFHAAASLGLEAALASQVVLTSSAACKYFTEDDAPPDELCDFDRQVQTGDGGFLMGAGVSLAGGVRLVDQVFLTLRLNFAHYLFDPQDTELGLPVGGQIALGYRLF